MTLEGHTCLTLGKAFLYDLICVSGSFRAFILVKSRMMDALRGFKYDNGLKDGRAVMRQQCIQIPITISKTNCNFDFTL